MSDNKLFIEELKYLVENDLSLTEFNLNQLQERFNKSPLFISNLYQLISNNKLFLPFFQNIESAVYDCLIHEEMNNDKTYYGATLHVAELFDTTQTYIKCKVNHLYKENKKAG
ncbi:hypothetical protein [Bacillus weihaiensis]|uniref:Uncharacterized protein n=1 Tax=Bacillus weihaiensis TaxID=1547283 RepID=A0A1L3MS97_9BACI|nr:hypothetical protein [Bacillus weihaiensis]APH05154.1 hypothetical protein A9C19_10565 [Bacillus weihaiensis]